MASQNDPIFTLKDMNEILMALHQAQQIPFCLMIQGASPKTEAEWCERQFALPDAKVNR